MALIDLNKKYRTRDGRPVKIYAIHVNTHERFVIHGAVQSEDGDWSIGEWTKSGSWTGQDNMTHNYDLAEVLPYEDFKIDDPVLVWDNEGQDKRKGHFAGISGNGNPMVWSDGKTSWTSKVTAIYAYVEKAEGKDL